ncbi:GAF domain-containing protein [Tabrizicola sp. J26]|uniref:GAF domain-containing protein n=1 Tax=Alitabrizicola rongguiensis TaxID=2909234 RepID=UPI001F48020A|nr:GAF domain-containing protein [Tabrizicola rongguiensis]MCF1709338.1 GAF domain-containing protein [Tabrizicola rongguiensis]
MAATPISLAPLRRSLEGIVAAVLATRDRAGTPNISMISQVHYVDDQHVALSYQFFNKTRRNLLETRLASVEVADPLTNATHRLTLEYLETQSAGPVFEEMRAKLAGIASHTGMAGVFRLLGADIFRVTDIEAVPSHLLPEPTNPRDPLKALRLSSARLRSCSDLTALFDATVDCLTGQFGVEHCMILMLDPDAERFFTLVSRGYAASGIGSEILLGEGIIGVAARERVPIRINHMTADYRYGAAIRESVIGSGIEWQAATEIPFPGLDSPSSQLAIPIMVQDKVFGVLFVESEQPMRFWHDDEDAMAVLADVLGACISSLSDCEVDIPEVETERAPPPIARSVTVRHFTRDDSVFLDHDYLIKGVAGAILWLLLRQHATTGRTEFTTRELRLDSTLRLPQHSENLDARLVLLRNRLNERSAPIRLEKSGRGKLRLCVAGGVTLESVGAETPLSV